MGFRRHPPPTVNPKYIFVMILFIIVVFSFIVYIQKIQQIYYAIEPGICKAKSIEKNMSVFSSLFSCLIILIIGLTLIRLTIYHEDTY